VSEHAVFSLYCLICKDCEPLVDFAAKFAAESVESIIEPLFIDVNSGLYVVE
jgi:hypothetical protein